MKKVIIRFFYLAVIIAVALVLSCETRPSLTVTDDDGGKVFNVADGSVFEVKLKAQLGTGFGWQRMSDLAIVEVCSEPKQVSAEDKEKAGGIDYQIFTYKAVKKGKEIINFRYGQPWDKDAKALKNYSVTIIVKE